MFHVYFLFFKDMWKTMKIIFMLIGEFNKDGKYILLHFFYNF